MQPGQEETKAQQAMMAAINRASEEAAALREKFCLNCQHAQREKDGRLSAMPYCLRLGVRSRVTGEPEGPSCWAERQSGEGDRCGPEGRYFEAMRSKA